MTPDALDRLAFKRYPSQASQFATGHLEILRRLPLAVLPSILQQIIAYDWKFPAEKEQLSDQMDALQALDTRALARAVSPFSSIVLSAELTRFDWVNQPARFLELLTPHLWSTRQIDEYRDAAKHFMDALEIAKAPDQSDHRTVLFVAGAELASSAYPLFSKLRPHGLCFTNVAPDEARTWPLEVLAGNAAKSPELYKHWYLDGGDAWTLPPAAGGITTLSYPMLDPVRKAVLATMDRAIRTGDGPELLHSRMAAMQPADCGASAITPDPVLQHFVVDLFTQGSGTQIYSTTFVQWTAREILRRAQPDTLLVRVAPRVRQRGLNELIARQRGETDLDPEGSIPDADLAAHYTWLELQKLPGSSNSVFLAWFPGRGEALLIGSSVPRNAVSGTRMNIRQIYSLATPR